MYCYYKLKILENDKNSVVAHSRFHTLVQRIRVYRVEARNGEEVRKSK